MEEVVFQRIVTFTTTSPKGIDGELKIVRLPAAKAYKSRSSSAPSSTHDQLFLDLCPLEIRHPVSSTKLEAQSKQDLRIRQVVVKLIDSTELPFVSLRFLNNEDLISFKSALQLPPSPASAAGPDSSYDSQLELLQPYPSVKASKYFNGTEGMGGPWKVLMSSDAISTYRKMDSTIAEIVFRKVKTLSNGEFKGDSGKQLSTFDKTHGVPIYEAKLTGDLRIVWAIDIEEDQDRDEDTQVIKIYGIWTHAQIDSKPFKKLVDHPSRSSQLFVERRTQGIDTRTRKINVPIVFHHTSMDEKARLDPPETPKPDLEDSEELHRLLVLEKFTSCSQTAFDTFRSASTPNHVFNLPYEEQKIVNHVGSIFVVGGPGTGKTAMIIFRMVGTQRAFAFDRPPRQLFTTSSSLLAIKAREAFDTMSDTLDFTTRSNEQSSDNEQSSELASGEEEPMTNKVLDSLPSKWSDLEDRNFPLFVSFDQLCTLLEGDLVPSPSKSKKLPPLVTHRDFQKRYWKALDAKLLVGLEPFGVLGEILGVIKGGDQSTIFGPLSRTVYENLSARAYPSFAQKRSTLYSIFLAYEKLKKKWGERDAADRTLALLQAMEGNSSGILPVDFVYVDEAQDHLITDCSLIRKICSSSSNLVFTSDRAQTIAAGSSFRMEDLSSHFYRLEKSDAKKSHRVPQRPTSFQLRRNYRSQASICRFANQLLGLASELFPGSVDQLEGEEGLVAGPLPEFFASKEKGKASFLELFTKDGETPIEFGAHQVLLVRNDAAKKAFRQFIGPENEVGLVLTILESKGLEFSDVLIWNFFEDSMASPSQWKLLLRNLPGEKTPPWDSTKNAILCTELKTLNVAVTRARHRVWFWDHSESSVTMQRLFASEGTIFSPPVTYGPHLPPAIAQPSSSEDYEKLGHELFARRLFEDASRMFARAGKRLDADYSSVLRLLELELEKEPKDRRLALVADYLSKIGRRAQYEGRNSISLDCFVRAGDLFVDLKDSENAANAFEAAGMKDLRAEKLESLRLEELKMEYVRSLGGRKEE